MLPKNIQRFIEAFSKLPLVGPRMAYRLVFNLLKLDKQTLKNVESALLGLKDIDRCPKCFFIKNTEDELCKICSDPKRNGDQIAVVEKETDLISIEKSGAFKGLYAVIGESESRNKLGASQKLRLERLKKLAGDRPEGKFNEVIIAVNPTTEGDYLAGRISQEIRGVARKITRLGRGIPTGGEIEFADEETLSNALETRR